MERTRWSAVARVTETADVFKSIPGLRVNSVGFRSKVLLRPACAAVIAVEGAVSSLASVAIIAGEAVTESRRAITDALVRALSHRVEVVRVGDLPNPSDVHRTGAK